MKKICTFVVTERFRTYLKTNFNDKRVSKSIDNESVISPFLERSVNSKDALAYKYLSTMTEEKNFVTNSQRAKVTPMPCFDAQEYHTQRLYSIIATFYSQYYVSDYNQHHNAFLNNFLESTEVQHLSIKDIQRRVDLNNTNLEFLSNLKEAWINFKKFNNINTDQL